MEAVPQVPDSYGIIHFEMYEITANLCFATYKALQLTYLLQLNRQVWPFGVPKTCIYRSSGPEARQLGTGSEATIGSMGNLRSIQQ